MYKNYSNWQNVIQFIESYRLMGATFFTFYVLSASPLITTRILPWYKKQGLVEVISWPSCREFYLCQNTRLNDCLYRNRLRSKFMSFVDLDEHMLTAKQNETLVQLFEDIQENNPTVAQFKIGTRFAIVLSAINSEWPTGMKRAAKGSPTSLFPAFSPSVEITSFSYYNHKPCVVANRTYTMFVHFATEAKGGNRAVGRDRAWTLHHVDHQHYRDIVDWARTKAAGDYGELIRTAPRNYVIRESFDKKLKNNMADVMNSIAGAA